ncbi:hypothetical protein JXA32_07375 [Candidatus Sumerlaeota bacterium]|nr:hypothetical protein [Candidatus Sumerlaeota bacterium]
MKMKHRITNRLALLILTLATIPWGSVSAQNAILFSDTFDNEEEGSRPQSWSVVEADVPASRYWYIKDKQYYTGEGDNIGGDRLSFSVIKDVIGKNWTDYEIRVNFWMPDNSGQLLVVGRWQDRSNHYRLFLRSSGSGRQLGIQRMKNNDLESLGLAIDGTNGVSIPKFESAQSKAESHELVLRFEGSTLTAKLDGRMYLTANDDAFHMGQAGLGIWFNEVYFDNVQVSSLGEGGAAGKYTVYRIIVLPNATFDDATQFKQLLSNQGIIDVEMVSDEEGKFNVVVGTCSTMEEAVRRRAVLESSGVLVHAIKSVEYERKGVEQTLKIQVDQVPSRDEAQRVKRSLEADGFRPVYIVDQKAPPYLICVGEFREAARNEAEDMRQKLIRSGYSQTRIVRSELHNMDIVNDKAVQGEPEIDSDALRKLINDNKDVWEELTRDQQKQMRDILEREVDQKIEKKFIEKDKEYQSLIKQLDERQRKVFEELRDQIRQSKEQSVEQQRHITEMVNEINDFITAGRWDEASALFEQMKTDAPNDGRIPELERKISWRQAEDPMVVQAGLDKERERQIASQLANLITMAQLSAQDKDYPEAIRNMSQYIGMTTDPVKKKEGQQLKKHYEELQEQQERIEREIGAGDQIKIEQTFKILMVVVGIVGALLVLVILLMVLSSIKRRRERNELRATLQSLSMKPMVELQGEAMGGAKAPGKTLSDGSAPAVARLESSQSDEDYSQYEMEEEEDTYSGMEEAELDASDLERTQFDMANAAGDESQDLEQADDQDLYAESEEEELPVGAEASTDQSGSGDDGDIMLDIEELEDEELQISTGKQPTESVTASAEALPIGLELEGVNTEENITVDPKAALESDVEQTALLPEDDMPVLDDSGPMKPPVHTAPPVAAQSGLIFAQDFREELVGNVPRGWQGEFDFASLQVADESPPNGSSRYMLFEKPRGDGRAYCYTTFDDVKGRVRVEFDLRCNDKNKYLLGFYIEKDQDFKNSIHTVIHRAASQTSPMLRIHGVPVPYEMGKWVNVRYDINLGNGTLNGYVNGQMVASSVRLDTNPGSLNTLAIRDNNPTTGVLLIGNIRISRF